MYWRSSEGQVTEVNQEQMARIKSAGFERTAVEDKMHQERIRASVMAEVERHIRDIKGGEMNVVELVVKPEDFEVIEEVAVPSEAMGDAPAQKNGKVGDFIGYKPDFPTFF